jgi:hypothetical protein
MDTASTVSMYRNRPERARSAAERGLGHVPSRTPAAVRLACQLTRAFGRIGMGDQFDEALADTRRQLDQLADQGSGLFSVDAGRIASYAATASIWLGRPRQAVRHAEDALTFYAETAPADRSPTREAISRLDLGLALISMGSPDRAVDEALRALNSERVTDAVLSRAGDVDAALHRSYPTMAGAREVHDRYTVLTQDPMPRSVS